MGLREFLGKNRFSQEQQRTPHLNFTKAHISVTVPSSLKSTGMSRAEKIGLNCNREAGKSVKQHVCPPGSAVCNLGCVPERGCPGEANPTARRRLPSAPSFLPGAGAPPRARRRNRAGGERGLREGAGAAGGSRWSGSPAARRTVTLPEPLARLCGLLSARQLMPSVQASHSWL